MRKCKILRPASKSFASINLWLPNAAVSIYETVKRRKRCCSRLPELNRLWESECCTLLTAVSFGTRRRCFEKFNFFLTSARAKLSSLGNEANLSTENLMTALRCPALLASYAYLLRWILAFECLLSYELNDTCKAKEMKPRVFLSRTHLVLLSLALRFSFCSQLSLPLSFCLTVRKAHYCSRENIAAFFGNARKSQCICPRPFKPIRCLCYDGDSPWDTWVLFFTHTGLHSSSRSKIFRWLFFY